MTKTQVIQTQTINDSEDKLFSEENVVKSVFWKPENIGDKTSGYLVEKKIRPNTLKEGTNQTIYTLMRDDGSKINVAGRVGNPQVIPGLEACKMGQLVGVKFIEIKKHQKAGYNDIKVIKAFAIEEFRPDLLEKHKGTGFESLDLAGPDGSGEPF